MVGDGRGDSLDAASYIRLENASDPQISSNDGSNADQKCSATALQNPPQTLDHGLVHGCHNIVCNVLRGSIAGTIAKTMVYPLDRLKMIYQVKLSTVGRFRIRRFARELHQLARAEGILSLWKGNLAAVCRTFPHSGIVFYCFDAYHPIFLSAFPGYPNFSRLLAGGCSGVTSTLLTYPLDVWNTRMAVSQGRFRYGQVALLSVEGAKSATRGLFPTLLGIFPYAGISFFVFDSLKTRQLVRPQRPDLYRRTLTPFESVVCGGIAGVLSQTATYPLDTIRKTLQANTFLYYYQQPGHLGKATHPGVIEAANFIYRCQGLRGFYNGMSLNWAKGFLATGVAYGINEQLKRAAHMT